MTEDCFHILKLLCQHFRNHFSTIGVNGINEMIQNFTDGKEDIVSDYGMDSQPKFGTTSEPK